MEKDVRGDVSGLRRVTGNEKQLHQSRNDHWENADANCKTDITKTGTVRREAESRCGGIQSAGTEAGERYCHLWIQSGVWKRAGGVGNAGKDAC